MSVKWYCNFHSWLYLGSFWLIPYRKYVYLVLLSIIKFRYSILIIDYFDIGFQAFPSIGPGWVNWCSEFTATLLCHMNLMHLNAPQTLSGSRCPSAAFHQLPRLPESRLRKKADKTKEGMTFNWLKVIWSSCLMYSRSTVEVLNK